MHAQCCQQTCDTSHGSCGILICTPLNSAQPQKHLGVRTSLYWYRCTLSKVSCMEVASRARLSAPSDGTWNSSRSGHAALDITELIVASAALHADNMLIILVKNFTYNNKN